MAEENEVKTETMDDFAKEIDHSMREIHVGDIIDGTVTGVTDSEVMVDLQYYAPGIIRAQDYSADPHFSLKEDVHPGDAVKATVLRMDDGKGNLLLSRREAIADLVWDEFKKMMDEKTETELKVTEAVKAGVVGYLNGVRAFVPASQLSLSYVENLEDFVGKTIPVRVITADKEHDRLVVGSRDLLREKRDAERAERISNIKPGLVTEGTVQSLQSYGAFVSLGDGVDGLVHISRITNKKRLKHPKEVLSVGDKVKVKITIKADRDYDFVQVVDKRAACLEPVVQTSGYRWGYYIAPKDNATNYYFDRLSKGSHVIETEYYIDRDGSYNTGICTVQCAYSPEYNGREGARMITVE